MKYPRVEVEWMDIEDDNRWQDVNEAAASSCPVCFTAGWLIKARADALVIAPTINSDQCSRTTIPLGCVRAVRKLRRDGELTEHGLTRTDTDTHKLVRGRKG